MQELLHIMRRLRAPDGCPWDREQSHESLRPYLLEEACEAIDAISIGRPQDIKDELGDVLLQIAFHAVIAEEAGDFDYEDIEGGIVDKLVRRHPHVFADTRVDSAEEVVVHWEAIKAQERASSGAEGNAERSLAERIPASLPALARAYEYHKKAKLPPSSQADIHQAVDSGDVGAMLMAVVAFARGKKENPEIALREHLQGAMASHGEPQALGTGA